jgi:hypothetical protein
VTATSRCPVRHDFDPLSAEFLTDPFAVLATVREQPVFYAPSLDYYVVTRHADIAAVFRDVATYSAAAAQLPLVALEPEAARILLDGGHRPQPSMVSLDQPEHTRLRRPATRAFTAARVQAMAPEILARVDALLDAVADEAAFELVEALCFPLPADTIFSLMGVPRADYPRLRAWCGSRAALAWGRPAPEEQIDIATNMVAYRRYLRELVDAKAAAPGDDFTSDLLAIHREDPDKLSLDEIASILFSLSFAGHETTNNLIGNTVRRLLEDPSRWARVVADPALAAGAVDAAVRPVGASLAPDHDQGHDAVRRRAPGGREIVPLARGGGPRRRCLGRPRRVRPRTSRRQGPPRVRWPQHPPLPRRGPGPVGSHDRGPAARRTVPQPVDARPTDPVPPEHQLPRTATTAGRDRQTLTLTTGDLPSPAHHEVAVGPH